MFIRICTATTLALAALIASPLSARHPTVVVTAPAPDSDLPTRHVSYADLNLAAQPGQRTLHRRVDSAISGVCTDSGFDTRDFGYDRCRHDAWSGATPQIARAVRRASEMASSGGSAIPLGAGIAIVIH